MVPLTGVEPVRYRYRGILSPLCLPIPPQRHNVFVWNTHSIITHFSLAVKHSSAIFFARGDAAAQMAFGFVEFEHFTHLCIQQRIHTPQSFADIFMYRAFADTEMGGGGTHRGSRFQNIHRQSSYTLLIDSFHVLHSPVFIGTSYELRRRNMRRENIPLQRVDFFDKMRYTKL